MTTELDFHVRDEDGKPAIAVSLTALNEKDEELLKDVHDAIAEVENARD